MKINQYYHDFASVIYVREDGQLAHYFPDFIVRIADGVYLVETKAEGDVSNVNVKQKRIATLDWVAKVNEIRPEQRMKCVWHYVLLGQNTFNGLSEKDATTQEILDYALLSKEKVEGKLSGYFGTDEPAR